MTEENLKDSRITEAQSAESGTGRVDPAEKYFHDALKISFFILKIIMVVLVIAFLASGFEEVASNEQALVLRFGKIRGVGENRLLGPGAHWVFPYPIDEFVKIPVSKKETIAIDSFWYYQKPHETLPETPIRKDRFGETLVPTRDGYCITRSERQTESISDFEGSDYNIIHSKWKLVYQINDPEKFFRNVYMPDVEAGQSYADVIPKSLEVKSLLQDIVADAVVTVMVNYSIDEAISSQDRIPKHVKRLLQKKLNQIESGITAVSVQLTDITWPRQVDYAFQASIRASQTSQKNISEAKSYAENTINEAGGPVATELIEQIHNMGIADERGEALWARLAGQAQEIIAQARAYRTKVAETAKANAEYLQTILPEYKKSPRLVLQEIYQEAIEYVLNNADEKLIIQPTQGAKGSEIRVMINRDPSIKPKSQKQK